MNAIEMALAAALKKATDSLVERLPEIIANLPPDVMGTIGQIGKSVASFQASIDRVEHNQILIMARLGISPEQVSNQKELTDGREH